LLPAGLATVLIVLSRDRPFLRELWSVAAAAAQGAVFLLMIPPVLAGSPTTWAVVSLAGNVTLTLRADPLGVLFGTVASLLWLLTTIYSIGYTRALREHAQTRYFAAFALSLFATVGVALAGNLLTFFCFFELLTVATFPLVVHRGTPEAARAGRVYLAYTLSGGAALLVTAALVHHLAAPAEFRPGGVLATSGAGPLMLWTIFALGLLGCGVKAALVPLHTWLPVAMIAPTPVSALLHAVAVVKAGVFGVARVAGYVFGLPLLSDLGAATLLQTVAVVTILVGSLTALRQQNLKRLLAFSTVSQLSYIVLGVALTTRAALAGAAFHLASHAFLKITLFFCVGSLNVAAHAETVADVRGLGRRMPVTLTAFALAAVMLAGVPPGMAFVSKWNLLVGAMDEAAWIAAGALVVSGVLNLAYFAPVVIAAFGKPSAPEPMAEAPLTMLVPLLLTLTAALCLGLVPDMGPRLWSLAELVASDLAEGR
jgi:formate hydrogenlyase subunit 3/multisubunit Na+/H+ antiporter MnhD subunit